MLKRLTAAGCLCLFFAALALAAPTLLPVFQGGTGAATFTAHGILLGEGTSAVSVTAAMTDGQLLVGQTGANPLPKTLSGDATLSSSGALTIANNAVTDGKLRQGTARTVIGRSANSTGNVADIAGTGAHTFLGDSGTALAFAQPLFSDLSGSASCSQLPALTGDITSSSCATTLATVNSNTGTWGDATHVAQITLNAKGLATAAASVAITASGVGGWSLTGNASTSPGTNFLGTTDSQALELKTAGTLALYIDTSQQVGIGTGSPGALLDVNGAAILEGAVQFSGVLTPVVGSDFNDYAPSGWSATTGSQIIAQATTNHSISGLTSGSNGRLVTIFNKGSANITLLNESTSSLGANRFTLAGGDLILAAGYGCVLQYDGINIRWRLVGSVSAPGTGTVSSIATTSPISGGTVTTTGTISCPTCVTSAASLTAHAQVIGSATTQATKTIGACTDGQLVVGATSADPACQTVSGAGSLTSGGVLTVNMLDPSQTYSGNMIVNFPSVTGGTDWWSVETGMTGTYSDTTTESLPKTVNKNLFKLVTSGAGSGKAFYQRLNTADHDALNSAASGTVISCSEWVYQASGGATITAELKDSAGTVNGSATTTANAAWTLVKVEGITVPNSVTYEDWRTYVAANSKTIYMTNPICSVGPKALPWRENPQILVYADSNAVVSTASQNNSVYATQSFTSQTHPLAFALFLIGKITSSGTAISLNIRPTFTSLGAGTDTTLAFTQVANLPVSGNKLVLCNASQQIDYEASSATNTTIVISLHNYMRWFN